jgi:hypothetical protein
LAQVLAQVLIQVLIEVLIQVLIQVLAQILAQERGLRSPSRSVTPLTFEGGNRLAGLDHDRRWFTAATTLPHDFGGKFQDRLIGCGYGLLSLGPELGLAERRPTTSLFHRNCFILNVDSTQYAPEFPNLRPESDGFQIPH